MSQADYTEASKVEAQLRKATNALHEMAGAVGAARQVREFSSDRRKTLLARFVAPLLKDESAAAAEALARANGEYQAGLTEFATQYRDAEAVIAKWQATQATFEAARSLLSMSKEMLRQIE